MIGESVYNARPIYVLRLRPAPLSLSRVICFLLPIFLFQGLETKNGSAMALRVYLPQGSFGTGSCTDAESSVPPLVKLPCTHATHSVSCFMHVDNLIAIVYCTYYVIYSKF